MTTESVTTLRIDTATALKNVADLKAYIKDLKDALNDVDATEEQNRQTIGELTKAQNMLKDVMHTSTLSVQEARQSFDVAGKTYNQLVHQLAELKKVWRDTNDESARADIAKNINRINDQLKGMDASVGSYKRNVGNYANSIAEIAGLFGKAGSTAQVLTGGIGTATTALKAMSATPVIAILGALVSVLDKVIKSFKSSEENVQALQIALAPLKSVTDATTKVFQWLGSALANVASKITDVLLKMNILKASALERQQEMIDSIALQNRTREVNEQNAVSEQKIAELRAKMAEKDKYSYAERKKYAEEWKSEVMAIAQRNKEVAQEELRLLEAEASHTANSSEFNDRLSEARIKVTNATTAYNEQLRAVNKEIANLNIRLADHAQIVEEVAEKYQFLTREEVNQIFDKIFAEQDAKNRAIEQENKELTEIVKNDTDALTLEIQAMFDAEVKAMMDAYEQEKAIADQKKALYFTLAGSASAMVSAIADAYDGEADMTERQLNMIKNMRIASAIIDTISGALGAFMGITKSTGGLGIAGAIAEASAVTATGMAQVAQIRKTKISKHSAGSGGSASISPAMPMITTTIPTTRLLTTASETENLNRSNKDQRVILVLSDVEDARKKVSVQTSEASFG